MAGPMLGLPTFDPIGNVTPFTYRDGDTYLSILEKVRNNLNLNVEQVNAVTTAVNLIGEVANSAVATANEAAADASAASLSAAESANLINAPAKDVLDTIMGGDTADFVTTTNVALTAQDADIASLTTDVQGAVSVSNGVNARMGQIAVLVTDYPTINDAIAAAPAGATVLLPPGVTEISTPVLIDKYLHFKGQGMDASILHADGDAIIVQDGQTSVHISDMSIISTVKYSQTPNTRTGILFENGVAGWPGYCAVDNVAIRGFQTAIQTNGLFSSRLTRLAISDGLVGIDVYGLSENNTISDSEISVGYGTTRYPGSVCIRLNGQKSITDPTGLMSEGWTIKGNAALFGGDYAVHARGYMNFLIDHNMIDFCHVAGVLVTNTADGIAGGNVGIVNNYIAMSTSAVGSACIDISSTVDSTEGCRIVGNQVKSYPGSDVDYGVRITNNVGSAAIIMGNTFAGFTVNDIKVGSTPTMVIGNRCLSYNTNNIHVDTGQHNIVSDNYCEIGMFDDSSAGYPNMYSVVGRHKIAYGTGVPTGQKWDLGDRVLNSAPVAGAPKGWICTTAGSPGFWTSEGAL